MLNFKKNNAWSDGTPVSAQDAVFTWKRLLDTEADFEAASLLYEIKNARSAKQGECSIDDVGIYAVDELVLEIKFDRCIVVCDGGVKIVDHIGQIHFDFCTLDILAVDLSVVAGNK